MRTIAAPPVSALVGFALTVCATLSGTPLAGQDFDAFIAVPRRISIFRPI